MLIEAIGYLASAIVVVSLSMSSVVRLRWLSLLGSVTYAIYGLAIDSYPVVVTNVVVAAINIRHLVSLSRRDRHLGATPISNDAPYLTDFLSAFGADMLRSHTRCEVRPGAKTWLLIRDGLPVGVLSGRVSGEEFEVDLDYVIPSFRDLKIGSWVFGGGAKFLRSLGVRRAVASPDQLGVHESYLKRIGFVLDKGRFVKEIAGFPSRSFPSRKSE